MTAPPSAVAGPSLFARFAYPPNERGLCGPDDHAALLGYAASGEVDGGLRQLAQGFEGAWPYLELIAGAAHLADPLDPRVVEAYWIGNRLTRTVAASSLAREVDERFRPRAGRDLDSVVDAVRRGLGPTHAFHVFCVYPWIGLLRSGRTHPALDVLDQCRIRWGEVLELDGDLAVVRAQRLQVAGGRLVLGPAQAEVVRRSLGGDVLGGELGVGDRVALHWEWVCGRITSGQGHRLEADLAACLAQVGTLGGVLRP